MRTIKREIVGAVIVSKDNKVLLGKTGKSAKGVYSGNWVVPGGGVDEGETKTQALIREIKEETRIDVSNYNIEFVNVSHGKSPKKLKDTGEIVEVDMIFNNYKVIIDNKTAAEIGDNPTEELQEIRWFDFTEFKENQIAPPTIKLLKDLKLYQ